MPSALRRRVDADPTLLVLVGLSVLGILARLVELGTRVIYYDEAWFNYWVLQFLEHGGWEYRPILHGPFFARVNSIVFPVLGANDATARLVVALIGGLLPLAAWLFREHLRRSEVVALGVFLACNPILLYYSRFARKDLPLAAFMLVTLGLLVRAWDTRRRRYLYGAALSLGVAFGTKESVLLWILAWLGAAALVADRYLLRARDRAAGGGPVATVATALDRAAAGLRAWWSAGVLAILVFLAVVVYFYAPRAGPGQSIGLWAALTGEFGTLPAVIEQSTVGALRAALEYWAGGSIQDHAYLPYFSDTLRTMLAGALGVSLLSVVGFLHDRYTGEGPRAIVAFSFYTGAAAVVGYPIANNLPVPWSTVHAVVPLAIPAAVGAGLVYRWGRSRLQSAGDGPLDRSRLPARPTRAVLAVVLAVALVASMGSAAVTTSYLAPEESPEGPDGGHEIVYYAQAPGELREVTTHIADVADRDPAGPDVLFVGSPMAADNETALERPPGKPAWFARNPLFWYTASHDADVASAETPGDVGPNPAPIVVTTPAHREAVAASLSSEYEGRHYPLDDLGDREAVVFARWPDG